MSDSGPSFIFVERAFPALSRRTCSIDLISRHGVSDYIATSGEDTMFLPTMRYTHLEQIDISHKARDVMNKIYSQLKPNLRAV